MASAVNLAKIKQIEVACDVGMGPACCVRRLNCILISRQSIRVIGN